MWGSGRSGLSVLDVIPVLERFVAQPINVVYPFDYYLLWDSAGAVRRSIHIYDIVPAAGHVAMSRVPAVHVYDVVPILVQMHASRQSVIHAYDIVLQPDSAARSGQVTISATDVLTASEWFFRVNKALRIFEYHAPFEVAAASPLPTIYAEDLSIVYDLAAPLEAVKTVSAFDILIRDSAAYTKSHSPLFFLLMQRRVPVRHLTLSVLDAISISESADFGRTAVISASDYVALDAVEHGKSYSPLFFLLTQRRVPVRHLILSVSDGVHVMDAASLSVMKVLTVFDAVQVVDYATSKSITIHMYDYGLVYDYVPHVPPGGIAYKSLYANIGMRTISVFDRIVPYESAWIGPRVITISAFDRVAPYESVWVWPSAVVIHAYDYLVSDRASVVKRSVHAFDVIQTRESVNIVRIA